MISMFEFGLDSVVLGVRQSLYSLVPLPGPRMLVFRLIDEIATHDIWRHGKNPVPRHER
jgi:hypothetical protein